MAEQKKGTWWAIKGDQKKGRIFYNKIMETQDMYGRNWLLEKLKLKMALACSSSFS